MKDLPTLSQSEYMPPTLLPRHAWTSDNPSYVNQAEHDRTGFTLMPVNGR